MGGMQIPLGQLATLRYEAGPAAIKSEDAALTGYVFFGKHQGFADVETVEAVRNFLNENLSGLPEGVSFNFAGTYENQQRSIATLRIVIPISLLLIFMVLHLHFRSVSTTALVFSGIAVAWAGGFILLWLYGQPGFLAFFERRELFNIHTVNLSIAVWVGFLALFGIASDDGVVMATYLDQKFREPQDSLVGPGCNILTESPAVAKGYGLARRINADRIERIFPTRDVVERGWRYYDRNGTQCSGNHWKIKPTDFTILKI
jgi:Cu(I)/Ag(I) efflux system membrane protein CusA/SilA